MWLIVCEPHDWSALWVHAHLAASGAEAIEIVTPAQLVFSPRSVHRLGEGSPTLEIELADGRQIASTEVSGVLNRFSTLPTDHLAAVKASDRSYAIEELSALVLSWLTCLRNVVNPPHPLGMAGHHRHPTEWASLAVAAGFGSGPDVSPHPIMRIVFDGEVFGPPASDELMESCVRLGDLAETRLLGIVANEEHGLSRFVSATPTPDLRVGAWPFLDALSTLWTAA